MIFLEEVLSLLSKYEIEAIVVGNAAAALQGAPVTTLDVDFMIRDTERNLKKLGELSLEMKASLTRPFEPASNMMRLMTHEIQCDFLFRLDGISKFESLRSKSSKIQIGSQTALVADLKDVIKSKKAAGRDKDLASLPILEKTLSIKNGLSQLEENDLIATDSGS